MGRMKWSGWGDEGVSFTHYGKPALGPFLERHLAIDVERPASRPRGVRARRHPGSGPARRPAPRPGESPGKRPCLDRRTRPAFIDSGATLSQHHAVGTEHSRWLEQDISAPGVAMVRALFDRMDPGANLNPGKII
jgi:hypothetical protein